MNARELRIGNWVSMEGFPEPNDGIVGQVTQINTETNTISIKDKAIGCEEDFYPIPLSESWLERAGFEMEKRVHESGNYDWIAESGWLSIMGLNGEARVRLRTAGTLTLLDSIKFLHQIQNLHFALTGTDLAFNTLK